MSLRARVVAAEKQYVWPPYTPHDRHQRQDPLVIASAEGPWVTDVDGRRYIDAHASWWTMTLGHRHPRLLAALQRQASTLDHVAAGAATHPAVAFLAEELIAVAPRGLARVHFCDNGSTAVEAAVKLAVQYWHNLGRPEKTGFVSLGGAYHGDTAAAMSLASIAEFRGPFAPLLFRTVQLPALWSHPHAVQTLVAYLAEHAAHTAAVVVEPLCHGAAGMQMYGAEQLRAIAELAARHEVLLIADEVFTGYGRTGTMWACEQAGVAPDLLCIGKGFTGGVLPMAATLATEAIYRAFDGGLPRAFMHGHTFCGHPLGAAVAREVLAVFRDEAVVEGVAARGEILARAVQSWQAQGFGTGARSLGMIAALDLRAGRAGADGGGGYRGTGLGWTVAQAARERGVYLRPLGDTIYLTPPLNTPLPVLEELVSAVTEALAAGCW